METQRCMGCMQLKGTSVVCPKCGYSLDEERNPVVLPYETALNNKFLVGRVLGKPGGFGITYLAWDSILHTAVAIKEYLPRDLAKRAANGVNVILHNPTQDKEQFIFGLHQFLKEARILAQFSHPNVVRVREFFQQNNTAYLVMDYYEGVSLEEFVHKKGGKVSEQRAFSVMLPILEGLSSVHQKGFLHRDIKPANIYLTKGDIPILLDFGAARFAVSQKVERPSMIITEGFAPFEQYLEDADGALGPWTDIYACGATLYNITTGITPMNAINRYQKDELIPPVEVSPALTHQLSRAIMAALILDHDKRPQSVQELQALLLGHETEVSASDNTIDIDAEIEKLDALPSTKTHSPPIVATPVESVFTETIASRPLNTHSIRCPYCRTINTLTIRQDINKLHCYQCGKKVSPSSVAKKFSYMVLGLVLVTVTLAGMLALKMTRGLQISEAISMRFSDNHHNEQKKAESLENQNDTGTEFVVEEHVSPNIENIEHIEEPIDSSHEIKAENNEPSTNRIENTTPSIKLPDEEPVIMPPPPPIVEPLRKVPEFAINACKDKHEGDLCEANNGTIHGSCYNIMQQLACIPSEHHK